MDIDDIDYWDRHCKKPAKVPKYKKRKLIVEDILKELVNRIHFEDVMDSIVPPGDKNEQH